MRKSLMTILILSAVGADSANAAVPGGSNIALSDYPAPACIRPPAVPQPEKPADTKDKAAVDAFNIKVQAYNTKIAVFNVAMTTFNACMKTYVDNANNDIMRIKQTVEAAQPATH
jgi:hypothetical protein